MQWSKVISIKMFCIILIISGFVYGCCASIGPRLTKEVRIEINSVSVDTNVEFDPNAIHYSGSGTQTGSSFGALGFLIGTITDRSPGRKIMNVMQENNINLDKMLVTKFRERLKEKKLFPHLIMSDGNAKFTFKISSYGFLKKVYSKRLKPRISVNIYLEKVDGSVIWNNRSWAPDNTDAYKYEEYIENPELIRKVFDQAISAIVDNFIKNLEFE